MAKKDKKWDSVPATAFKTEEELKAELLKKEAKKRGKYEEKLSVDMSFEDLIKLSVGQSPTMKSLTDIDKNNKEK